MDKTMRKEWDYEDIANNRCDRDSWFHFGTNKDGTMWAQYETEEDSNIDPYVAGASILGEVGLRIVKTYKYKDDPNSVYFDVVEKTDESMKLREWNESPYRFIKSKEVRDDDGFLTDYTWWYDERDGIHFFMFGDRDIYRPNRDYADWECDSYEEAEEWFWNYDTEEFVDDRFDEDYKKGLINYYKIIYGEGKPGEKEEIVKGEYRDVVRTAARHADGWGYNIVKMNVNESLKEDISDYEIDKVYKKLSKLNNVDFGALEDEFLKTRPSLKDAVYKFYGTILNTKSYCKDFVQWAKEEKGIDLKGLPCKESYRRR